MAQAIHHLDGNPSNNDLENLAVVDVRENAAQDEAAYTAGLAAETRDALTKPEHQSNVFSSWSDGFAAGLLDLDTATHRAYQRGKHEATRQALVTRWIFFGAGLIGGVLAGIASFA